MIFIELFGTEPVPQGSKTAFVNPKTGRAILADANKRTKPWREALAAKAVEDMAESGEKMIESGPVEAFVYLYFNRPKSHYGSGKNASKLKEGYWVGKETKPDIDKLLRSVFDALTGVAFRDDSQVTQVMVTKRYGNPAGVRVQIRRGI